MIAFAFIAVIVLAAFGAGGSVVALSQDNGDPDRGRQVFVDSCAMCHGSDAAGMMGMHPSLRGAVERLSREGVEVTIRNGRATRPPMPSFEDRLTDAEIEDVIAYLDALPEGPRDADPEAQDRPTDADAGDGNDDVLPWILVAALAAVAAGPGGYLLGHRRGATGPR